MSDESRIVKDPICGKDVDTLRARAVAIFGGVTYYFCSFDCKSKFKDPRQALPSPAVPPKATGERRGRDPAALPPPPEEEVPVRYARTRPRRNTGDMSAPVVDIDLSADKPKQAGEPSVEMEVPRSSRAWAWIAIVMLIIAGGVILFTLKR